MPTSRSSIRARTLSLATIWLTEKCLPMSRRKSRNETFAVHEALSTSRAGFCFVSKSSSFASWTFTLAMLWSRISLVSNWRSCGLAAGIAHHAGRPAGNGDRMMAEQLKPSQRQQRHEIADVQAVGGRVEPAVKRDRRGDLFFSSSAASVQSATRPRHFSSSRMLTRAD